MDYLVKALITALKLILTFDYEVMNCTLVSLKVSCIAVFFATTIGLPLGLLIALNQFIGKRTIITILNTLMALPTVVVGLLVFAFISRQGPLGVLGLLFTPTAMVVGQFILATPIITALSISAVQGVDPKIRLTALALGARSFQVVIPIIVEARFAIMAAIIAGFGRIIGEVGSAMMLGGNIKGFTRSITTAIALETSKGEFSLGLALGIILISVALSINILLRTLQQHS